FGLAARHEVSTERDGRVGVVGLQAQGLLEVGLGSIVHPELVECPAAQSPDRRVKRPGGNGLGELGLAALGLSDPGEGESVPDLPECVVSVFAVDHLVRLAAEMKQPCDTGMRKNETPVLERSSENLDKVGIGELEKRASLLAVTSIPVGDRDVGIDHASM